MSRFARIKSEDERLDALGDPSNFGDFDENDPASVGRFMKKMGREFGDDLGDDFDDAMEEAMSESSEEQAEGLSESSSGSESGAGDDL
jgi:hypothetical protein